MKFNPNINIDISKLKSFLDWKLSASSLGEFFYKKIQLIMLIILVLTTAYLVSIWYQYIFHSDWSEVRVQEYIKTKQNQSSTIFNRENFDKIVEEYNSRNSEFEKKLENIEDIFRLNK